MVQTIPAERMMLYDLEQQFGLQQVTEAAFFPEWQTDLPQLQDHEIQRLERVKLAYANLARRSVLESAVKLAIVSPLLDLAGFFLPPFYISTEEAVRIVAQDAGVRVRGRIDVLVLKDQLWLLIIESKRFVFLKLTSQDTPRYARSNEFILERGNDLNWALQILKRIAGVIASGTRLIGAGPVK